MNETENQDRHHYFWMMKTLEAYQEGQIGLGNLIHVLETYLLELHNKTDTWETSFYNHWGKLEIIYASRIGQTPFQLTDRDHSVIAEAIANLKDMIRPKLDDEGTSRLTRGKRERKG